MEKQVINRPAIGIDFGTSYSCVGICRNDKVEIIINEQGNRTTPSCVAFSASDQLVGDAAKNQSHKNPRNTIFGAKRLIGRKYKAVNCGLLPYKVEADDEGNPKVVVEYKGEKKRFFPEEISALVLANMKSIAETFLETPVEDAVITVPANFNDSQRRATKEAGRMAGLNVIRLMNEPIAAAVAYHLDKARDLSDGGSKNVLVFDLGGGTFDVSVLEMQGDVVKVRATAGDTYLGGDDFDERMVQYSVQEFKRRRKVDISSNPAALSRLRAACEKAKRILSFAAETDVEVDCLYKTTDFGCKFTRAKFEELNEDLFDRCIAIVNHCLDDAKMNKNEIDKLVLVGGSSRIPKVQQMLQEMFGGKELCKSINPDEAVAYGAAVEAAKMAGESNRMVCDLVLLDVIPLSLGTHIRDGEMDVVIRRNTPFPVKEQLTYITSWDNQRVLDISVYEGERAMVVNNRFLGKFSIKGLPPAPAGMTKVTVCFEIDADGILHVWAEHKESGVREEITVDKRTTMGLYEDDTERMVNDAVIHKMEDERCRHKAGKRYDLRTTMYNMRWRVQHGGEAVRMSAEGRRKVEEGIEDASAWLASNPEAEASEFQERTRRLWECWHGAFDNSPETADRAEWIKEPQPISPENGQDSPDDRDKSKKDNTIQSKKMDSSPSWCLRVICCMGK